MSNQISHNYGTIVVPAKSSTTLYVNINRQFMQNENQREMSVICMTVDYDKMMLEDGSLYYPEAYVYFDNLIVELDTTEVTVEKKLDSLNEILYFDDESDLEYIRELGERYLNESVNTWITHEWTDGTGSSVHYNKNPMYIHENNTGSLEWRINPTMQQKYKNENNQYLITSDYKQKMFLTGFSVDGYYLDQLYLTSLQKGGVKILVDVYNAGTYDKEVAFGIHDNAGLSDTDQWYKLKKGTWTTLEISDFSHIDWTQGISRLWLLTSVRDVEEPMSFYVNNLRIEYDVVEVEHHKSGVPQYEWKDTTALKIYTSYEYQIVKKGETVRLSKVTFSKNDVVATYELDGKQISNDETFVPEMNGKKCLIITAKDSYGNTSKKYVYYTVDEEGNRLNKVYALDETEGLMSHFGCTALNNLSMKLVKFADMKDLNGKSVAVKENGSDIEQEMYEKGITSGMSMQIYKTCGRVTFANPLSVNWDKNYDSLYFYFYNAGYGPITINFNNYTQTIDAGTGWQKVILGNVNSKTDYSLISALGKSGMANSIVDLEDGVGTFLILSSEGNYFEQCLMTSIYGE